MLLLLADVARELLLLWRWCWVNWCLMVQPDLNALCRFGVTGVNLWCYPKIKWPSVGPTEYGTQVCLWLVCYVEIFIKWSFSSQRWLLSTCVSQRVWLNTGRAYIRGRRGISEIDVAVDAVFSQTVKSTLLLPRDALQCRVQYCYCMSSVRLSVCLSVCDVGGSW